MSALRKITSLTAPLPDSVARACAERLQCSVSQAYGLTEAVALTHFTPRHSLKIASLGVPVPDTECRIVDVVSRDDVRSGELGEVWVRGPQVMKGYHNNPEITADIIDGDGWLRTCDIGYTDSDGYLFVVDRSKKLARLRGLHRQDGELLRAAIEDIAARLKASDRLRVQSVLLNSVRESVVSTDVGNNVTFWNRGAEQLFGYSAEEAMGKHVASLIVPDGVDFVDAGKTEALRTHGHLELAGDAPPEGRVDHLDRRRGVDRHRRGRAAGRVPGHSSRRDRAAQGRGTTAISGAAARQRRSNQSSRPTWTTGSRSGPRAPRRCSGTAPTRCSGSRWRR